MLNKSDDTLSFINPTTGDELDRVATGEGPHEVAVSYDGELAVVANYGRETPGNTLSVVDMFDRWVVRTIDLGRHTRPHGIWFLDKNHHVAVTTEGSQSLLVVSVRTGAIRKVIDTGQRVSHMLTVGPENTAWVANIGSGSVSVLEPRGPGAHRRDRDRRRSGGHRDPARRRGDLGHEPSGGHGQRDRLALARDPGDDRRASASRPRRRRTGGHGTDELPDPHQVHARRGSSRSSPTAVAGDVSVIDVATRREVKRIAMELSAVESTDERLFANLGGSDGSGPVPVGILVEPRGRWAFVANTNADIVTVIDLETLEVSGRIPTGREPDGLGWSYLNRFQYEERGVSSFILDGSH